MLLPALAVALAMGAAGVSLWLVAERSAGATSGPRADTRLPAARLALLAHAAAYPDAYGPASAGPGHLVCPDTDTPLDAPGTSLAADRLAPGADAAFRGDGPDPPCGNGPLAIGRLPRHVTLASGRRAFHHEPRQRLVYAVSTRYVNNPPGRVVNPDTGAAGRDEAAAVVIDPGGVALPAAALAGARDPRELLERVREVVRRSSGPRAARALPHVFVASDALLDAAARRVAAWFVETATAAAVRRCEAARRADGDSDGDSGVGGSAGAGGAGAGTAKAGATCEPNWPDGRCGDGSVWAWLDERAPPACRPGGDSAAGGGTSSVPPLPDAIENTPRGRHWFVRNGWDRHVRVARTEGCRDRAAGSCRLQAVRIDGATPLLRLTDPGREPVEPYRRPRLRPHSRPRSRS